ncbi:hypothetical protein [Phaeobacter inhibens]|uniref:hypothetical protein n=1 Tax=Phaeobacter inhibens TaxID=221822 RepID=UPI0018F5553B|nr:hypothetical protein [Phaeobacter inhibens]
MKFATPFGTRSLRFAQLANPRQDRVKLPPVLEPREPQAFPHSRNHHRVPPRLNTLDILNADLIGNALLFDNQHALCGHDVGDRTKGTMDEQPDHQRHWRAKQDNDYLSQRWCNPGVSGVNDLLTGKKLDCRVFVHLAYLPFVI